MSSATKSVDFNDASKRAGKQRVRDAVQKALVAVPEVVVAAATPVGKLKANATAGTVARPHYLLKNEGVFHVGVGEDGELQEPQFICSPLKVEAKTRDHNSEGWGRLLTWTDADGKHHQWAAPAELLVGDPREFLRQLAAGGVEMSAARSTPQRLLGYVIQERTDARARSVAAPGWHAARYVLPTGESYGEGDDRIVYQHSGGLVHQYAQAGTLDEWKAQVAARCVGNSRLLLAVSAMFAGPLLGFTGATGGGFHFVGGSSSGKSTALRAAASVVGPPEYAREWRTTANGLEGVAVLHNDATLILDELAQIDPRQAGDAAYLLANGSGKSRANRAGDARASARWRTLILSAGEIGLAQHMAEAGKQVRAGQAVRLADVPADVEDGFGIFETLHDAADGAGLSALLKDATANAYGTAWPLWLGYLTAVDHPKLAASLRKSVDEFHAEHVPADAVGEVRRVADRFAIAAYAGELASACPHRLTGWKKGLARAGAAACFKAWLHQRGGAGSADTAALLAQVRMFFEAHGQSRLEELQGYADGRGPVHNRAGFRRNDGVGVVEYLVLPEAFRREICAGFDARRAATALMEAGWLKSADKGKSSQVIRVPGMGTVRVYVFDSRPIHGH